MTEMTEEAFAAKLKAKSAKKKVVQGKVAEPAAKAEEMGQADFAALMKKKSAKQTVIQGKGQAPAEKAEEMSQEDFAAKLKSKAKTRTVAKHDDAATAKEQQSNQEFSEEFTTGSVSTWSFSTLKSYEQCPWRVKLHKVDKIKQDSGEAAERGTVFHDALEHYVRGTGDDIPTDRKSKIEVFVKDIDELKALYVQRVVTLEERWGIRKDWSPCSWEDDEIWGKGALDGFVIEASGLQGKEAVTFDVAGELEFTDAKGEKHNLSTYWIQNPDVAIRISLSCRIIDYKTGRKFGNEMKHADQGLCYALHAGHRYPEIDVFQTEFWYLDQGEKTIRSYNRKQLGILLTRYHNRARKLTEATTFMPAANVYNCQYCAYGCNKKKDGSTYGNGVCGHDAYRGLDDEEL